MNPTSSKSPKPDSQWVSLWLDGELSPQEEQQLRQAMAEDPQLAQLAEQFRQLRQQLRQLPRRQLGPDFAQEVLRRIGSAPPPSWQSATPIRQTDASGAGRVWGRWMLWGAGALAVAAAVVVMFWPHSGTHSPAPALKVARHGSASSSAYLGHHEELEQYDVGLLLPSEDLVPAKESGERSRVKSKADKASGALGGAFSGALGGAGLGAPTPGPAFLATLPDQAPIKTVRKDALVLQWHQLPAVLQQELLRSGVGSAPLAVVQVGVPAELWQQGAVRSQLGQWMLDISANAAARRRVGPLALRSTSPPVPPKAGGGALQKQAPAAPNHVVARVRMTPRQLTRFVQLLSQQVEKGLFQFVNRGAVEPLARQRAKATGVAKIQSEAPAPSGAFSAKASAGSQAPRTPTPGELQLVLVPRAQQNLAPAGKAGASQAPAPGRRKPIRSSQTEQLQEAKPSVPSPSPASGQLPVVNYWILVELVPPEPQLPLVAPPPRSAAGR